MRTIANREGLDSAWLQWWSLYITYTLRLLNTTIAVFKQFNPFYFAIKSFLTKWVLNPSKSSRCIKASFHIPENRLNFLTTDGFRRKISMKLVYQYMVIFVNFSSTSSHLHPLQVENCDRNSRLVVDEDDNGKFRLKRVKDKHLQMFGVKLNKYQ